MCTSRIVGKEHINLDNLEEEISTKLNQIQEEMVEMGANKLNSSIKKLPQLINEDGWKLSEKIENDKVYWTAFEGTDSDAEIIERLTGLTFLGESLDNLDSEMECCITGKNTNCKVFLAKTY